MPKILQTILFEDLKSINKPVDFNSSIFIFKTSYISPFDNRKWFDLLELLTDDLKSEVQKYVRWEDQHNNLLGKLLVYFSYFILKGEKLNFNYFQRNENNKPFILGSDLNFNISHTDKMVLCAVTLNKIKIGVDIEEIKKININDYENIFHSNEFTEIKNDKMLYHFFKYWTRKEAYTKAIGKGIVMSLEEIDTTKEVIVENEINYNLQTFSFDKYIGSLVYDLTENLKKVNWIEVKF